MNTSEILSRSSPVSMRKPSSPNAIGCRRAGRRHKPACSTDQSVRQRIARLLDIADRMQCSALQHIDQVGIGIDVIDLEISPPMWQSPHSCRIASVEPLPDGHTGLQTPWQCQSSLA